MSAPEFPAELVERVKGAMAREPMQDSYAALALAALSEAFAWQPMETVPKQQPVLCVNKFETIEIAALVEADWLNMIGDRFEPVGWQHLPPARRP